MTNLVLELHAGEAIIVNGASFRFRTRSRIELTTRANRAALGLTAPDEDAGLGMRSFRPRPGFEHHEFQLVEGLPRVRLTSLTPGLVGREVC